MKRIFYWPAFVLMFALAPAVAQTTSPSSSTNQPGPPRQQNPAGTDQPPSATVQPGPDTQTATSPGDAQSQIQNAMKNDARLSHDNIMVSVSGNEVELTGDVGSKSEKDAASKIAEKYAGSLNVKNRLQVRGEDAPPDNKMGVSDTTLSEPQTGTPDTGNSAGDLQAQIQNAIRNEPTLANDNVRVSVTDEGIELTGAVATAKEKLTAQRIAQSYAENRKVSDRITVTGHARDSSTNPGQNPDRSSSGSQPPNR